MKLFTHIPYATKRLISFFVPIPDIRLFGPSELLYSCVILQIIRCKFGLGRDLLRPAMIPPYFLIPSYSFLTIGLSFRTNVYLPNYLGFDVLAPK